MAAPKTPEEQLYPHIQKLEFLVADPSSSRKSIRQLLSQLGAKPHQVHVVEKLGDAKELIAVKKPQVIFADYEMLGSSGFELVEIHQREVPANLPRLFFLLTSKDSNMVASSAAEDSVDAVLVKPFTFDALKTGVVDLLQKKINPTPFQKTIEEGKKFIQQKQYDEAIVHFRKAKGLDPKSPLSYCGEAEALVLQGNPKEAMQAFSQSLTKNPMHYRTLMGILDLLLEEKDYVKAYEIGRRVAANHTVPLQRIPDLIRLSVLNLKFEDVLEFYKFADAITEAEANVSVYLAAGLVVCGLYFLNNGNQVAAVDAFRKAEVAAKSSPKIVKRILVALISEGLESEVQVLLARASDEVKESVDLKIAEMEYLCKQGKIQDALGLAVEMMKHRVKDARVYHMGINLSLDAHRSPEIIEDMIAQAQQNCSGQGQAFEEYKSKLRH
ncbi:tetratricopeptide repeat protein [Bdellovibrionota bacterium FG-1]